VQEVDGFRAQIGLQGRGGLDVVFLDSQCLHEHLRYLRMEFIRRCHGLIPSQEVEDEKRSWPYLGQRAARISHQALRGSSTCALGVRWRGASWAARQLIVDQKSGFVCRVLHEDAPDLFNHGGMIQANVEAVYEQLRVDAVEVR